MKTGKTFIISGPSGVGKSTVLRELLRDRDDLYFSISATTRAPREGEIDGVHYHFINVDRFREMIQEDEFLEYAEYVGNFYGTPKRYVDEAMAQGKDVILDIEVQGALQVIGKRPDTVRIFIAPPSWDALEQRLLSQNAQHKDWTCSEDMMKRTKEGKALYLHCLPADISGVSCKEGEVDASVFDRYLVPLYKEASFKPYIIAAMIMMSQVKDPVSALRALDAADSSRKHF